MCAVIKSHHKSHQFYCVQYLSFFWISQSSYSGCRHQSFVDSSVVVYVSHQWLNTLLCSRGAHLYRSFHIRSYSRFRFRVVAYSKASYHGILTKAEHRLICLKLGCGTVQDQGRFRKIFSTIFKSWSVVMSWPPITFDGRTTVKLLMRTG